MAEGQRLRLDLPKDYVDRKPEAVLRLGDLIVVRHRSGKASWDIDTSSIKGCCVDASVRRGRRVEPLGDGMPMGSLAILGITSLIGVIVSHVIVVFDFIEEQHERGAPLREIMRWESRVHPRQASCRAEGTPCDKRAEREVIMLEFVTPNS